MHSLARKLPLHAAVLYTDEEGVENQGLSRTVLAIVNLTSLKHTVTVHGVHSLTDLLYTLGGEGSVPQCLFSKPLNLL